MSITSYAEILERQLDTLPAADAQQRIRELEQAVSDLTNELRKHTPKPRRLKAVS